MLDYKNTKLILDSSNLKEGTIAWQTPSNIALVKYWGKHGVQLPRNPSISLTLDEAHTKTYMSYSGDKRKDVDIDLDFYFEGKHNEAFAAKIRKFLLNVSDIFPFVKQLKFTIKSENSFPHSSGIASSASSMGALALCLCSLESDLFGTLKDDKEFRQKASYVARLGSGSACRSVYATAGLWGASGSIPHSSDEYAIPYQDEIHKVFHTFHDDILIVSQGEKAVSSRAGHALMDGNDYAAPRYAQAKQRLNRLLHAMEGGDLETFGNITENEALTLHALMMTSNPSFILMKPNTLEMINRIRSYRADTKLPVYFTLDAGPNIHLLYPDDIFLEVNDFVKTQLVPLCEDEMRIADKVGLGPLQL
jgi:diphosphomevalonate decarboxylase